MNQQHRSKILIVDDKAENLYALDNLLKGTEAEVYLAHSGNQALSLTLHHSFALILLDVQMPGMDGFETAALIRQDEETRHLPIIFMTALSIERHYVFQGYEAGAVDYLIKPIDSEILLSKVKVFLALDRYQSQLAALNQQNQLLLNCAGEGILSLGLGGHIQFANPAALQILERTESQLRDLHLHELLYAEEDKAVPPWEQSPIYMAYQCGQPYRVDDARLWIRAGQYVSVSYTSAPIENDKGEFGGGVIVFQDITRRKQSEQKLLELAQFDPLTGLANRTLFQEFLGQSLLRAERRKGHMALLLLDLDHFKDINDTLGHDTGDQLLKSVAQRIHKSVSPSDSPGAEDDNAHLLQSVAQRLKSHLRRTDLVARLGGDEFAIVLDDISHSQDAALVAHKILQRLAPAHQLGNYEVYVSPSIGIATCPESGIDAGALFKAADTALYQAKAQGRNNYQFYVSDMHRTAMEKMRLEQDLRQAVERQQLSLHYQPQVAVADERIHGIEVLLRWHHPELGMISPSRFIPLAERTGIINQLGDWVWQGACRQFQLWRQQGLVGEEVRLAINLSSRQLIRDDCVTLLQQALADCGLPASCLDIELTENTLMDKQEATIRVLEQLRGLGMRVSLDDFGCGYSSFNQIHSLPIDCLKIAQPLVAKLGQEPKHDAVVKTIINMAATLDFEVIAEGVETAAQADFLRAHGCNLIQGFYTSPPLGVQLMTQLLKAQLLESLSEAVDATAGPLLQRTSAPVACCLDIEAGG